MSTEAAAALDALWNFAEREVEHKQAMFEFRATA